jgi:CoA transferase family III
VLELDVVSSLHSSARLEHAASLECYRGRLSDPRRLDPAYTNVAHHRAAAQGVLGAHDDQQSMARAVASWCKADLENAIVEIGGCAAEMRSIAQWEDHAQGRAVAAEPLVHIAETDLARAPEWRVLPARPLEGLRVLDLTRVLAGPVATRFLAGLGFDAARRRRLSGGLIDIGLDAYGWSGPWAARRGFDSLVQMSAGIADCGMRRLRADKPVPLPVQALDHATGYLMAAVAIRGITRRLKRERGTEARLSLARTAKLLIDHEAPSEEPLFAAETEADRCPAVEKTDWGDAQRLIPPLAIGSIAMRWEYPARKLGSDVPR